jgi:hypothetical protein
MLLAPAVLLAIPIAWVIVTPKFRISRVLSLLVWCSLVVALLWLADPVRYGRLTVFVRLLPRFLSYRACFFPVLVANFAILRKLDYRWQNEW